jgi:CRISPR-associated endonuclease/helicase Cas3
MEENYLAKKIENGRNFLLKDHLVLTERIGKILAKKVLEPEVYSEYEDIISISCILHDIGKLNPLFQEYMRNETDYEVLNTFHNQHGWAFIEQFLEDEDKQIKRSKIYRRNKDVISLIAKLIYFHHGNKDFLNNNLNKTIVDILNSDFKNRDQTLKEMCEFSKELLKNINGKDFSELINDECSDINFYSEKIPTLFESNIESIRNNGIFLMLKSILIVSDRLASNEEFLKFTDEEISNKIDQIYANRVIDSPKLIESADKERFKIQEKVSKLKSKTTIINSPSGNGKTVKGILWALNKGKKCIWVCPTNDIALSVFYSFNKNLELVSLDNKVTFELYLSGEVKMTSDNNPTKGFDSDFIITNIDNFENRVFDENLPNDELLVSNGSVIFDEYHMYYTNEGSLLGLFNSIMFGRNTLTNGNTLLLSASIISQADEKWGDGVVYYPERYKYIEENVEKRFKINFIEYDEETILNSIKNNENLCGFFNARKTIQYFYKKLDDKKIKIIHSMFEKSDRENTIKTLLEDFGKNSNENKKYTKYLSNQIIQQSIDVSFKTGFEIIRSHFDTIQRIGRFIRWGESKEPVEYTFYYFNSKKGKSKKVKQHTKQNEITAISNLYDYDLSKKWTEYIKEKYDNSVDKIFTKREIEEWFNDFNQKYYEDIKDFFFNQILFKSCKNLLKINIKRKYKKESENKIYKANGNVLRSTNKEIFVIAEKLYEPYGFTEPFTYTSYDEKGSFKSELKLNDNTDINEFMLDLYKRAKESKDERYDFDEFIKAYENNKINFGNLFDYLGKYSNKPIILNKEFYTKEKGLY